jgi:hypothetical protein
MSLSTNTTYRVFLEKLGGTDPTQFVGNDGELFYDPNGNSLKISDGSTPGGATIGGGGGASEAFKTIAVSGQSDVVADSATDTLTLVAGGNMTITTNAGGDSVTFASSGGGGGSSFFVQNATGIHTTSNVGVGTTTATQTLTVDGTIGFSDSHILIGDSNTGSSLQPAANKNIFIGDGAGTSNTTGSYNNFFGSNAGRNTTIGAYNNFHGSGAGNANTTGSYNNFFGNYTGALTNDGSYNSFFGNQAGNSNISGSNNTFIGNNAGYKNTTGQYNTFLGNYGGYSNTEGNSNLAAGDNAGYNNTIGKFNNFLGSSSGSNNTTGSYNVFLGSYSGVSIGASHRVIIGSGNNDGGDYYFDSPNTTTNAYLAVGVRTDINPSKYWLIGDENFNIGINSTAPTAKLDVLGDVRVGDSNSQGVILTSPNGTQYRLVVDNTGNLSTSAV